MIAAPFRGGLQAASVFAMVACLIAAAASLMRGGRAVETGAPAAGGVRLPAPAPAPEPAEQQVS